MLARLYSHTLGLSLFVSFVISFLAHFYSSLKDENEQFLRLALETMNDYFKDTRFGFESFQNRQSEFLFVFAIVVLSIFLK